jgi:hypothetical protein
MLAQVNVLAIRRGIKLLLKKHPLGHVVHMQLLNHPLTGSSQTIVKHMVYMPVTEFFLIMSLYYAQNDLLRKKLFWLHVV